MDAIKDRDLEIVVTPEMAKAGGEIVAGYDPDFSLPWEVAEAAYRRMAKSKSDGMDETKRLMGALVRMKPKPHEEIKGKKAKTPKQTTKKKK